MKINYTISKNDYWNFNKYAIFHIPKFRNQLFVNLLTIPVLVIAIGTLVELKFYLLLIIATLATFFGYFFVLKITRLRILGLVKNKKELYCEHVLELDENGIREATEAKEGFHEWKEIKSIKKNKDYIFIFMDSLAGHFIPKKSFESEEKAIEFFETAKGFWEKVNN